MAATKTGSQSLASWIFGGIAFAFLIGVFVFGPDEISAEKHRILGIMCAVLAGLFGYFFTGSMKLVTEGKLPGWGKVSIQAGGGMALFVLVLLWWGSDYAPVGRLEEKVEEILDDTAEIKEGITQIVEMLKDELSIKSKKIESLQGEVTRLRDIIPSDRAIQLAQQIPEDAGPYALALKAIAEKRFEDARRLLDKAQEQKEIELAEIYGTRGQTELYAGNYKGAAGWYEKALDLAPDNIDMGREAGIVFLYNAKYDESEPLLRQALETDKASFGPNDPNVAICLNNLALLLKHTNRLAEAEPLMERVSEIMEKSYGPNHHNVATALNNLAVLLHDTNRLAEAEPMYRRALAIDERSFGKDHLKVAIRLSNLAQLLQATKRLAEAESMMERVVQIFEESYGPNHPKVAVALNNLAGLLYKTKRFAKAEPMMRRALAIDEQSSGKDHPNVAIRLNNLAVLLKAMNRLAEAEPMMRRALVIDKLSLGEDNPRIAIDLNNLAKLLQATKRLAEAEPMYRRAIEILEKSLPPEHPITKKVRSNLESLKKKIKPNSY